MGAELVGRGWRWIIDFRVEEKRIRRRLPIHDKTLEAVAQARAKEIYAETWRSVDRASPKRNFPTFEEASELYIEAGGEARFLPRIVAHFGKKTRCSEIDEIAIARAARALYPPLPSPRQSGGNSECPSKRF